MIHGLLSREEFVTELRSGDFPRDACEHDRRLTTINIHPKSSPTMIPSIGKPGTAPASSCVVYEAVYAAGDFTIRGACVMPPVEFRHPVNLYEIYPLVIVPFSVGLMAASLSTQVW